MKILRVYNMTDNYAKGLAGIIAGETSISTVGKEGVGLSYRGYMIEELANMSTFEEVSYLLLHSELPDNDQLSSYKKRLKSKRCMPESLINILKQLPPSSHPMDVLRTVVSALGCLEPETQENNQYEIAERILSIAPVSLLYWYQHHHDTEFEINVDTDSSAELFLQLLLHKVPHRKFIDILDQSLILYAEHEFNASTFAARVSASTLTDFYSCITTAIGTLRGPLHGGANEATMELLTRYKTTETAELGIKQSLKNREKIMGFGHRVYKTSDPRSDIIKQSAILLGNLVNDRHYIPVSQLIEDVMWKEKKLFPNLDFYSAAAYHFMGIPVSLYTPLFVCSRLAGWSAHIIEQRKNNRLIRPNANYTGVGIRRYIELKDR